MSLLEICIRKPVTVLVGVILFGLFGTLAAMRLPIQLTPDVDQPLVTVTTRWEGASPQEVEREILDEQEERLKGISGLVKMTGTAVEGQATVQLEFQVGMDTSRALLEVSDKLRQVPSYPENVDEPVISAGETEGTNAIAWFILVRTKDSTVDPEEIPLLRTFMENRVKPRLERALGVSSVNVVGGREKEIHLEVDPVRLAGYGLDLLKVRDRLRERNVDISAGSIDAGKRALAVRTVGKFEDLDDIKRLVLSRDGADVVRFEDVGSVQLGYKEPDVIVRSFGQPAVAINALRQSGTNVLDVMEGLKEAVKKANEELLRERGLELVQVYDQTIYIYSAIDLVTENLWVGGVLAVLVLLLFLRSARSTLVIAVAIPVSIMGSFMALGALGRNLNVISLAGLAFAVGMVVDNSIVVLENVYRHRQMGKDGITAALDGVREVWGAVLASTLTTLAVFIPVVFVEAEAGQLFQDIAIAISAAVGLSLVVSVLFIPMASARLVTGTTSQRSGVFAKVMDILLLGPVGRGFANGVAAAVGWLGRGVIRKVVCVAAIVGASIYFSVALLPPMTYLPAGNQNLIIGFLIPPPGYNTDELIRIGKKIEERLAPYWVVRDGAPLPESLRRPEWYKGEAPLPGLLNFFYVARGQSIFMGGMSDDPTNIAPLAALFQYAAGDTPGTFVFSTQRSLFERGLTSGNSVDLEVSGPDLPEVQAAAGALFGTIFQRFGPPRPEPANFNLGAPELQVVTDSVRAAEQGLSVRDVGFMVQCMVDGAIISDYQYEGDVLDIKLVPRGMGQVADGGITPPPIDLEQLPIFTPEGSQVPLMTLASITETSAPTEILHLEERRAVKLVVQPPAGLEISSTMEILENEIIPPLRLAGAIAPEVDVALAGTADKLVSTSEALKLNFILALVITYLLLASLFESFLYPIVIMVSVPLASVGGILGLKIVHDVTGQQMDVLTMLGFVILVGTVVNNAILIVHQALQLNRSGEFERLPAIVESVRTRVRPIFMSTATSVLGMVPLVVFPGAGSELYRGLGSVVVGGLVASTFFTLIVVPLLLSLFMDGSALIAGAVARVRGR